MLFFHFHLLFLKHFIFGDHSSSIRARLSAAGNQSEVAWMLLNYSGWGYGPQSSTIKNSTALASYLLCEVLPLIEVGSATTSFLLCLGKYAKRTIKIFKPRPRSPENTLCDRRKEGNVLGNTFAVTRTCFTWKCQLVLDAANYLMGIMSLYIFISTQISSVFWWKDQWPGWGYGQESCFPCGYCGAGVLRGDLLCHCVPVPQWLPTNPCGQMLLIRYLSAAYVSSSH